MKIKPENSPLQAEIAYRLKSGVRQITVQQLELELAEIGYRLDRSMDCRSVARWMTGRRAGSSYPACSLYPRQIDDGKSAWNIEARRDQRFKALQALREKVFAVSRGAICEI